jgi:uracil-DNA glycosylase family 4
MSPPKPRRSERGLVMPPGRRTIPRAPAPRKPSRAPRDDDALAPPIVAKASGELLALDVQIRTCAACERAGPRRAFGTGYPRAAVLLVKEHPSASDLDTEGAMTDEAEALDKAFGALGIPLSWVYGATAVRCGSAPTSSEQIEACAVHLLVEIEAIEPTVVVAFGPRAVESVRALHGRCGLIVPDEIPQGRAVRLRPGLSLVATEPLPEGISKTDSKRRLWRDLQLVGELVGSPAGGGSAR